MLQSFAVLALALSVALSSIGHAQARHQAHGATTLVICTGYGLVRIIMDADGTPIEQTLPCPDCVVTLAAMLADVETGLRIQAHACAGAPAPQPVRACAAAGFWHDPRAPPAPV